MGDAPDQTMGYFFYSATLLLTKEFPFHELDWSLQHEMVFYVLAALIIPVLGVAGLAGALIVSSLAGIWFDLPWYLETLALYHPNTLIAYSTASCFAAT